MFVWKLTIGFFELLLLLYLIFNTVMGGILGWVLAELSYTSGAKIIVIGVIIGLINGTLKSLIFLCLYKKKIVND